MKNNPFISKEFTLIWSKYFNESKPVIQFKFIEDIAFVKNKFLPLYVNIGKNLTNGLSYRLQKDESDYKNKVFFIYDIPGYINLSNPKTGTLKLKSIKQYKGYLADLDNYTNLDDYIVDNFSSRSRRVFNKCNRRLKECFNIDYKMYYGDNITKDEYDFVFDNFNRLLKKRYNEKQINNHYLSDKKWNYLKELCYSMILSKKASLFVIFDKNTPINVSLNYMASNIGFGSLTVFDTDYSKFNIGFIDIMKHLEWCIENNIQIFDFSKGDFDYKKRWSNKAYNFEYHILYDSSSVISSSIASFLHVYFKLKQYLRDKNIHIFFHRMLFSLKGKMNKNKSVKIISLNDDLVENNWIEIDSSNIKYNFLKKHINNFSFKNSEFAENIVIYSIVNSTNEFVIKGKSKIEKLIFD